MPVERAWNVRSVRAADGGVWGKQAKLYRLDRSLNNYFAEWVFERPLGEVHVCNAGQSDKDMILLAEKDGETCGYPRGEVFTHKLRLLTAQVIPAAEEARMRLGGVEYVLVYRRTGKIRFGLGIARVVSKESAVLLQRIGSVNQKQLTHLEQELMRHVPVDVLPQQSGASVRLVSQERR
jgi:hypothetical protein